MSRTLLTSKSKVIKDTPLNGSLDNDFAFSMIWAAQEKWIHPKLGTDLYEKLQSDIAGATLAGNYATLVNDKIRPALSWWAYYEMLPTLRVRPVSHSVVVMNSEQSSPATLQEVNLLREQGKDNAEAYTQRLIEYILHNTDLFPEYSTNTEDDLAPDASNYTGGLNLEEPANSFLTKNGRKYPRGYYL